MKSIPQSWGRVQTAGSNSQLKISLEAGKPQEIFLKKVSEEKLSLWKKFRVQGAKTGGAGQSDNNSKTTGKNSPRCSLVTHSRKENKKPEIMVKLFAWKRSCYKYRCRGIAGTGRKTGLHSEGGADFKVMGTLGDLHVFVLFKMIILLSLDLVLTLSLLTWKVLLRWSRRMNCRGGCQKQPPRHYPEVAMLARLQVVLCV